MALKNNRWVAKAVVLSIFVFAVQLNVSYSQSALDTAKLMVEFVIDISKHAKKKKSDIFIIPQNGIELAYQYLNICEQDIYAKDYKFNEVFLEAIDGFGVEEVLYFKGLKINYDKLKGLQIIKEQYPSKIVLISDYVTENSAEANQVISTIYKANDFVFFTRDADNLHYEIIPELSFDNKSIVRDIRKLSDVRNHLYYIQPGYNYKKEYLEALSKTNYDLLLIDLFYGYNHGDVVKLSKEDLAQIRNKASGKGGDRILICYLNIGAAENYRKKEDGGYWEADWDDEAKMPKWIKHKYKNFEKTERWVEFYNPKWRQIIFSYVDDIIEAGFDGIYLDNTEAYYFLNNEDGGE